VYAYSITANLFKANDMVAGDGTVDLSGTRYEINKLTLGKGNNIFRAQQFDVNHLILNGALYNFRQSPNPAPNYFQVNQTLTTNTPCNGAVPKFRGQMLPTLLILLYLRLLTEMEPPLLQDIILLT
jgi:hypothetical protein